MIEWLLIPAAFLAIVAAYYAVATTCFRCFGRMRKEGDFLKCTNCGHEIFTGW